MRIGYLMFFVFIIMSGFGLAADMSTSSNATQAIFTKVQGKVQVLVPNRKKPKKAQKDLVVTQGDRIVTQEDSSAVLRLFDGSELKVEPNTEFVLSQMLKPSDQDKNFKFSLFIGKLTAVVKKLTSASSSFEIEAGGVVCGVRGTQFEMGYNPHQKSVVVNVTEGLVWARANGGPEHILAAGQHQNFNNVHPPGLGGSNSQNNKGGGANNNSNSGNGSNGSNNGTGGNGGGDSGNGSANGSGSTGGTTGSGGSTDSGTGSTGNGSGSGSNAGGPTGNSGPGSNPLGDPALQVMTNNVQKIISVNNNNTLNTAQQNTSIALHVGPGEVIP